MISKTIISTLTLASTLLTTNALPSRTHCRCTITDPKNPYGFASQNPEQITPPSHSPYRSPNKTPQTPPQHDICRTLGPELENFRHSNPKAYSDFLAHSPSTELWVEPASLSPSETETQTGTQTETESTPISEQTPLSTTVLLHLAAKKGLQGLGVVLPSSPTHRPQRRIVCRAEEVQNFTTYQDSIYTLVALQIVVGFVVLACVVEGIMLTARWFRTASSTEDSQFPPPRRPALRLVGDEKLLRAFSSHEAICSPGADKKLRSYRSATWHASPAISEPRVFDAWVDEDDEMNRPVM